MDRFLTRLSLSFSFHSMGKWDRQPRTNLYLHTKDRHSCAVPQADISMPLSTRTRKQGSTHTQREQSCQCRQDYYRKVQEEDVFCWLGERERRNGEKREGGADNNAYVCNGETGPPPQLAIANDGGSFLCTSQWLSLDALRVCVDSFSPPVPVLLMYTLFRSRLESKGEQGGCFWNGGSRRKKKKKGRNFGSARADLILVFGVGDEPEFQSRH